MLDIGDLDMKYKVHRIDVDSRNMQQTLELFLNGLEADVISIVPNIRPTFQFMGATAKVDYLLVVVKE